MYLLFSSFSAEAKAFGCNAAHCFLTFTVIQYAMNNCRTKSKVFVSFFFQDALNFMRNQQFEAPFIAFYRKEYVEPELNIHDLNKIYHWDEKVLPAVMVKFGRFLNVVNLQVNGSPDIFCSGLN